MQKMLLIHGWNYSNYSSSKCTDAWHDRQAFVKELQKHFVVVKLNLPGFCGTPDPSTPWQLDSYVNYVDEIIKQEKPEIILGYSFGGAIALRWKFISDNTSIKTFLISPAIIRKYKSNAFEKNIKKIIPQSISNSLRDFYLSKIKKNSYYSKATRVMKKTYRNIVVKDLRHELMGVSDPLVLIYGEQDSATPPSLIEGVIVKSSTKHTLEIIKNGGHDIANSHTNQLMETIIKYARMPL